LPGLQTCSYEVAIGKRAVLVRVSGMASMTNCLCLRDFLDEMQASSHSFIIIDLTRCTGMDSTFMGVLAGAASYVKAGRKTGVAVVNAGKPLVKLLESVGISELVFVDPDPFEMADVEFLHLEDRAGEEERLALIRTAHQHLIKAGAHNAKIFGPLLRQLEVEMKKRGLL